MATYHHLIHLQANTLQSQTLSSFQLLGGGGEQWFKFHSILTHTPIIMQKNFVFSSGAKAALAFKGGGFFWQWSLVSPLSLCNECGDMAG